MICCVPPTVLHETPHTRSPLCWVGSRECRWQFWRMLWPSPTTWCCSVSLHSASLPSSASQVHGGWNLELYITLCTSLIGLVAEVICYRSVGWSVCLSVCLYMFARSLKPWLWSLPNVDMWVCATSARHSKSLERRCQRCLV